MDDNLKSALGKMNISQCTTGANMSVDLLLDLEPDVFDKLTGFFDLNDEEIKAFSEYIESRKK